MKKKIISISLIIITVILFMVTIYLAKNKPYYKINLESLTFEEKEEVNNIKIYSKDDYDTFYQDYLNNNLPAIYITKFVFDGVTMYKTYDLDDFMENGNTYEPDVLEITNLNIHSNGKYELTGELVGGMVSVNTNDVDGKISLILNNASIDTKTKKVPVIYVYNKDINYSGAVVSINSLEGTKNYLEGGKFKKVSLVSKEEYNDFAEKYTSENKTNYTLYPSYYSVYTEEEINNVLFAKVEASIDDLKDGDPYYFYKGAGAISSDIDLYFEGKGYLEVVSKNKEGIETKGNLALLGGAGDYVVKASDDCLNTTTKGTNANNTILINVNSLYAVVSNEADEGDAIDSNGEIYINGGKIIAIAQTGADAGIDSERGTYINGGEVLATGDMYDEVKEDSKQRTMVLSFESKQEKNSILVLVDENETPLFAFKGDRDFQYLVYSSNKLDEKTYSLYRTTTIDGEEEYGFYDKINYFNKEIQMGYASNRLNGFNQFAGIPPMDNDRREMRESERPNMPNEENGGPREMPDNGPPEMKEGENGERPNMPNDGEVREFNSGNTKATNKDFAVTGIINRFSGIAPFSEE